MYNLKIETQGMSRFAFSTVPGWESHVLCVHYTRSLNHTLAPPSHPTPPQWLAILDIQLAYDLTKMITSGEKCFDTWLILCLEFTSVYSQAHLIDTHFFGSFFPESPLLLLDPPLPAAVRCAGREVEAVVVVTVELAVVVWVGINWEVGKVVGSHGGGFVAEDVGGDEEA